MDPRVPVTIRTGDEKLFLPSIPGSFTELQSFIQRVWDYRYNKILWNGTEIQDNATLFVAYLSSSAGEFLLDLKWEEIMSQDQFTVYLNNSIKMINEISEKALKENPNMKQEEILQRMKDIFISYSGMNAEIVTQLFQDHAADIQRSIAMLQEKFEKLRRFQEQAPDLPNLESLTENSEITLHGWRALTKYIRDKSRFLYNEIQTKYNAIRQDEYCRRDDKYSEALQMQQNEFKKLQDEGIIQACIDLNLTQEVMMMAMAKYSNDSIARDNIQNISDDKLLQNWIDSQGVKALPKAKYTQLLIEGLIIMANFLDTPNLTATKLNEIEFRRDDAWVKNFRYSHAKIAKSKQAYRAEQFANTQIQGLTENLESKLGRVREEIRVNTVANKT